MSVNKIIETQTFTSLGSRLRGEREERLKMSQETLAELMGVSKLTIGKYELNKTSPTADFLLQLESVGIDPVYVMTGKRQQISTWPDLDMAQALLGRGIQLRQGLRQDQVWISSFGLQWLVHLREARRMRREQGKPAWGRALLEELVALDSEDMCSIHLQCITLHGYEKQQTYQQLLVYEVTSPVLSPWSIAPTKTLQMRYELDAISADLPIDFHAAGADALQPVLVLQISEHAALLKGEVLTVGTP